MKLSQWTLLWKTAKNAVVTAVLIKAQGCISSHSDPIYISVRIASLVRYPADIGTFTEIFLPPQLKYVNQVAQEGIGSDYLWEALVLLTQARNLGFA